MAELMLYVRRMSGVYGLHPGTKLIDEELFYVFGAELGGLAEVVDGDEVAAGFAEGAADAAEQGASMSLAFARDVAHVFGINADAARDDWHNGAGCGKGGR